MRSMLYLLLIPVHTSTSGGGRAAQPRSYAAAPENPRSWCPQTRRLSESTTTMAPQARLQQRTPRLRAGFFLNDSTSRPTLVRQLHVGCFLRPFSAKESIE